MINKLPFYKLQGAGNDFVAIDNRQGHLTLDELITLTPRLCDRRFGVGADGLLAIFPSSISDYTMVYRNADGSDAGMCGNGGRGIARLANHLGFGYTHRFDVHQQVYTAEVAVDTVRLSFPATPSVRTFNDEQFGTIFQLYTGTDHIVVICSAEELDNTSWLKKKGQALRHDARFAPAGTNVNFVHPVADKKLQMVTYERGVEDLTLACGTGALASAITAHYLDKKAAKDASYQVFCPGGILEAQFSHSKSEQKYQQLVLSGPAQIVYTGEFIL